MNTVMIRGREYSKVEFFDYVFDTFVEVGRACTMDGAIRLAGELSVLRNILRSYGWLEEYQQWVAEGAGANEAAEELRRTLEAIPAAL